MKMLAALDLDPPPLIAGILALWQGQCQQPIAKLRSDPIAVHIIGQTELAMQHAIAPLADEVVLPAALLLFSLALLSLALLALLVVLPFGTDRQGAARDIDIDVPWIDAGKFGDDPIVIVTV